MHYKRGLRKCEKEQMFDSYMKTYIINSCKEFHRTIHKGKDYTKEVPLDDYIDELLVTGPDENELFSLLSFTADIPLDSLISEIKESISDELLYRSLQKLTDIQIKVFCLRSYFDFKFHIIAALCGTTEASAKNINRVAKNKLYRYYNSDSCLKRVG